MIDETMVFSTNEDGRVSVLGAWKERILITGELVRSGKTGVLWRNGDVVHFVVSNGRAAYRVIHEDDLNDVWTCDLQYSERRSA